MDEAKRRSSHDTLDGGPPSDERILLQVDLFDAVDEIDRVRRVAMVEAHKAAHRRPTPICAACEYEFGYGEPPAALYCMRPVFPKGEAFTLIAGAICPRCQKPPATTRCAPRRASLRACNRHRSGKAVCHGRGCHGHRCHGPQAPS